MGEMHIVSPHAYTEFRLAHIIRIPERNCCICRGVSAADTNVFIKAGLLPGYRLPTFGLIFLIMAHSKMMLVAQKKTRRMIKLSLNSQLERTCNEAATA
jgi:hypothetical protein